MAVIAQPPTGKPADPAQAILDVYATTLNGRQSAAYEAFLAESIGHIDDEGKVTTGRADVLAMYKSAIDGNDKFNVKK